MMRKEFDSVFSETVYDVLRRVFNETGAELILLYLETRLGLRREERRVWS